MSEHPMAENTLAPALLADIRGLIEASHAAVAVTVNAGLTLLYWRIGQGINDEVLNAVDGSGCSANRAQIGGVR